MFLCGMLGVGGLIDKMTESKANSKLDISIDDMS